MIYCNLKGGLGNMMFQIAATKSLSLKKNTFCSFPNFLQQINYLNNNKDYNPNLNYAEEYKNFLDLSTIQPNYNLNVYSYPFKYVDFIPNESSFYVDGFFQSEKYFSDHREKIINFFKPPESVENLIKNKYSFILDKNTTSVHVRRGDYLKYPGKHPPQSREYFMNSLETVKEFDLIVIFSDDISWCKDNIKLDNVFFVENEKDYIELFLMSKCKNNIISNSSFSWWGAWLNKNEKKIVVGPKNWFGEELYHESSEDILPETWIKI